MTAFKDAQMQWRVVSPPTWPAAPAEMSVSTYAEIAECPRRWALGAAEYPDLWNGRGYPPKPQMPALAGSVVHYALEIITKQLTRAGAPSPDHPLATQVLKEMGGYTYIVQYCVERMLKHFADNPRALPLLEHVQRTLRGQVPTLRTRVQTMLARLHLPLVAASVPSVSESTGQQPPRRGPLTNGTYLEVELRAKSIGWKGKADLLVVTDDACVIIDFKTGAADEAHKFQVRTYAVLWRLDDELNPTGRAVDRLVLAYEGCDVDVAPPNAADLATFEKEMVERRAAADAALSACPPEARPSAENCRYCGVRQLCGEYWTLQAQKVTSVDADSCFSDAELRILGRHGPLSWDAIVIHSRVAPVGKPALLRVPQPFEFEPGKRVRVLDAAVVFDPEGDEQPAIITLGIFSEIFALP